MNKCAAINEKKLAVQYGVLQAAYWMSFCTIYAFAAVFLLEKGFENSQVGVTIALGNVLGVILQPVFASAADSSGEDSFGEDSLHRMTVSLAGAAFTFLLILFLMPDVFLPVAVLFILTDALLQVMQPMINSISVYYVNRGISVDFGAARGVGSLSYAAISSLMGVLTARYHGTAILVAGMILMCLIGLVIFSMPVIREAGEAASSAMPQEERPVPERGGCLEEEHSEAAQPRRQSFFARYPRFAVGLAGITCLFTTHFMINNFMIQIIAPFGGTSVHMGTATAIAAAVEIPVMFLFSRMVKHVSSGRLFLISSVFFTVKASVYLIADSVPVLYAAQLLQAGGFALFIPASVCYVNEVMEDSDKFKGQAVMVGANTLGGVLGSLMGGVLLDAAGIQTTLAAGASVSALGTVILVGALRKKRPVS